MESPPSPSQVREVFDDAVELPPEQRAPFLDRACGSDGSGALRQTVERLLRAHDEAREFLADPTIPPPATMPSDVLPPGARVGNYTLLKPIGEGGCGTVYLARQDPPLVRRVAVSSSSPAWTRAR